MFLARVRGVAMLAGLLVAGWPVAAQPANDQAIVDARDAFRRGDRARLAALRSQAAQSAHPLAMWVDYWELKNRLNEATLQEVDAFYGRWPSSYVEDRLRNDWLLELGRRRDWAALAQDYPRFRMNDDREVTCYWLLARHQAGEDVRDAAVDAWQAQRDADDGCLQLAATLRAAGQLASAEVWGALRRSADVGRLRSARAAASMIGPEVAQAVGELFDSPARYLTRRQPGPSAVSRQLGALAVMRLASTDPDAARQQVEQPWFRALDKPWQAAAWGTVARQGALKQQPEAVAWYQHALSLRTQAGDGREFSDETLAWGVRAALRSARSDEARWGLVASAIEAMSLKEQLDPAWMYWKARALRARAAGGSAGDGARAAAQRLMETIASPLSFYGKLAIDDLDQVFTLPATPPPLTPAERQFAASHPGLARALGLIAAGLRGEGVREWNYSLRGMGDRELLAAAQLACEREVWDRCIHASERTRNEVDLAQRFPMPFRNEVLAVSKETGLDAAYVYGLIRQESRFVTTARSHVGASGLMQVMPATARWTAQRIGLDWRPEMIGDRQVNLRLGTTYLKLVLDDFGGSAPMAAAAYNAGPSRSRRWREGAPIEPAAWAETIPFNETRDYVKKVLSNATLYAAMLKTPATNSLKARLGGLIGPREASAPDTNKELP